MLYTDLTLPVVIILSVMALTLGFPAENIHENRFLVLDKISESQLRKEYPSSFIGRSMNNCQKNKTHRFLEPIIIKLENVLGKYEEKEKEFERFYPGFSHLTLPKIKKANSFGCLNFKQLKRKVSELTNEMRKINKNLKYLIYLEKQLNLKKHKSHEGRLKLLKGFRAEIKNLIVELKGSKKEKNKTRNKSLTRQMPEKAASANLSPNKSIKVKIEEWELLQNLKTILGQWMRNLKNFSKCL